MIRTRPMWKQCPTCRRQTWSRTAPRRARAGPDRRGRPPATRRNECERSGHRRTRPRRVPLSRWRSRVGRGPGQVRKTNPLVAGGFASLVDRGAAVRKPWLPYTCPVRSHPPVAAEPVGDHPLVRHSIQLTRCYTEAARCRAAQARAFQRQAEATAQALGEFHDPQPGSHYHGGGIGAAAGRSRRGRTALALGVAVPRTVSARPRGGRPPRPSSPRPCTSRADSTRRSGGSRSPRSWRRRRRRCAGEVARGAGQSACRGGNHNQAEQLAREAVALSGATDLFDLRGALADLGAVLHVAGRRDEAREAYD